ncbi:unnamed protein product [Brassica oleracea]
MIFHSLRSSQRPVMMATTPACLRPPPDPPPSTCMYAPLKALWPVIPPEPPDPPDGPLLLVLQMVLSSVVSPSSLAAVVYLTLLLGAALLCTNETTRSTQPSFGSPDLFGSASMKRLHHSTQPQIISSTLRIRSATPQPCPSPQCVQAVPTQPPSPPLSPPLVTKSQFAVCSNYPNLRSKHFTGSSWVISVKLLRFQYGNIGSRSLFLNSTIAFFSTSFEHIQVVAKHLGTQRLCWIFISKFRHLRSFLLSNSFEIHIVSLGSFFGGSECRALCMAKSFEFSSLKVFSDNSMLIRAISGKIQSKEIIGIVSDIRSISSGFAIIVFSRFFRSENLFVYNLAKQALQPFLLCTELFGVKPPF